MVGFRIISQVLRHLTDHEPDTVSLIRLDRAFPVNWFGTYVYMDGQKIQASRLKFPGAFHLMIYCADDLTGKEILIDEADMDMNAGRFHSAATMCPEPQKDRIMLYRVNEQAAAGESKYTELAFVSTQLFYHTVWKEAIKAQKVRLFKLDSVFTAEMIDAVLDELKRILCYCEKKYGQKASDYVRIKRTVNHIIEILNEERTNSAKLCVCVLK